MVAEHFLAVLRGDKRGPVAWLIRLTMLLLSWPYGLAMRLRNWAFERGWKRTERLPVPVISVGNLTTGGTGKTPFVEYLALWFRQQDRPVAILSRGYGAVQGCNDEALLLEENLPDVPHLQGPDRVALGRIAIEELDSEVLILDDGFQHRRLSRNLDVVLIDAGCPWGYGYLLPRGLLREPATGLRRAGMIVITRTDQVVPEKLIQIRTQIERVVPAVPVVESVHEPVTLINAAQESLDIQAVRDKPVAAFCGVGNPAAFQKTLEGLGADLRSFRTFPDHHNYSRQDIDDLRTWARQQATDCFVVTTQKDLVKVRLSRIGDRQLWAIRIRLRVTKGQDQLDRKLKETLA
jgi:tetraacyldisaccharide 4'-kinase